MDTIFKGNGEQFNDLLQSARERVKRLRQYTSQPISPQKEFFESSLLELDSLLDAMEIARNPLQDKQKSPKPIKQGIEENELKESEARFKLICESNLIGIGFGDLEGNIVGANDTFLRLLGYTHEDLEAGKLTCYQVTPSEYREVDEWVLEELQKSGGRKLLEKEYFHKNGSRIPALIDISFINNNKYQVIALILDITGRRQTEEALRDSQQRYRTIVDTARDGIWMIDAEARITFVNKRMAEMLGYTVQEMQALSLFDFIDREYHQEARELLQDRQKEIEEDFDFRFRRKDGKELWAIVSRNSIVDAEGKFSGSLGIITDITERKRIEGELQENEERFRQLVDNIEDIFWIVATETSRFVYISPAFEKILGFSYKALYENPRLWTEVIHPEERERVVTAFIKAMKTGEFELEFRIIRPDGSIRWLSSKGRTIRNEAGQIYRAVGISEDITERKKVEEVLKLQAQILENLAEGVVVANQEGYILLTNPAMDTMFGYERGSLIGEHVGVLNAYSPEESRRFVDQIIEKLMQQGFWSGEITNRKKDNTTFISHCSTTSIETSRGRAWVSVQQDITDWKQTNKRLQEQVALINQAHDAILVRDMEDRIIFWNNGAESLYGWSADEVQGKNIQQLLYRDYVEELKVAKQQLMESGDWVGELNQVTKGGKEIIVRTHWSLVSDEQGEMKSVLDINTDITKQKEIEARLLRAQRLDSIGTLATGIAHDINNVLAPILIAIDVLRLRLQDEESQHFLAMLKINTQRGVDLINQVLSFAKGVKSSRQVLQMKYLIEEIVNILKGILPKSISIRLSIEEELWVVTGDATQLQQVLMNLCTNAQDAMPNGGELLLEAKNIYLDQTEGNSRSFLKITITDTGVGIPADILDKIFEPFFTTKEVGKGTGLGLATAIGIIKDHGGFIDVSSRLGSGTEFKIYLPASEVDHALAEDDEEIELPFGNEEMILLIDDEPPIRDTFTRILKQFGYRILTASSAAEALGIYAVPENEIKVIITDVMMPDMDGLATIRAIQTLNPEVKIIAISGLDMSAKLDEAIGLGIVQAFLRKPFTTSNLLKILKKVLSS